MLGWFFYLLTILLIRYGSFKESDESGHLNQPRYDVMDWKWRVNSGATSISFKIRPSLSESIMIPEAFISVFEK